MNPFTRSKLLSGLVKMLLVLLLIGSCLFILWPVLDFLRSESMYFSSFRNSAAAADFDGDGDQDVIVLHLRNDTWIHITMWMNEGSSFSAGVIEWGPGLNRAGGLVFEGGIYTDVVTTDLDNDHDPDFLILTPESVLPFLNQGGTQAGESGLFRQGNPIRSPAAIYQLGSSLVVSDVDEDGRPDALVVAGCCAYSNYVKEIEAPPFSWLWLNSFDAEGRQVQAHTAELQGAGEFQIRSAALGDLDGDGLPDLFAAGQQSGTASPAVIFFNDGEGSFLFSDQRLGDFDGTAVALGDLDNDGDLDAITGTPQGAIFWTNQGGAQNGEAGRFALSTQELHGGETRQVFLADFDGDGALDALLAGDRRAVLWLNDGQGAFYRSTQSFGYTKRHGLAVMDFDGDGHLDLFAGAYIETPRVWINTGDGTFERLRNE